MKKFSSYIDDVKNATERNVERVESILPSGIFYDKNDDFIFDKDDNKQYLTNKRNRTKSLEDRVKLAVKKIKTLKGCKDCTDCEKCIRCEDCVSCSDCTDCESCENCVSCDELFNEKNMKNA